MVKFDNILYGGDYNPEQWLDRPEILSDDIKLFKKAHINTVTLGVFSWSMLEKNDGVYDFGWLSDIINNLNSNGIKTILATPSGARPKWLADKYPDVLRVDDCGNRMRFGGRHNHCMSSESYRRKTYEIDRKLSETFGKSDAVIAWHINNEMSGECYCENCQRLFREWLMKRYSDIDELNRAWCTVFWSHRYNSFDEIEAPMTNGETALHGLTLDWKRFTTYMHRDFTLMEKKAIRDGGSELPVTINMMYNFLGLNYQEFSDVVDFTSWDNYPLWHKYPLYDTAVDTAFEHDRIRSIKKEPYVMMESSPSSTNWQEVSKLRETGVLHLQQLQAVAHGADGALYFQMRQSVGASEKFHGAVIDHYGGADTRVFEEVSEVGAILDKIGKKVAGTVTDAKAAIIWDTESRWACLGSQGPRNSGMPDREIAIKSYRAIRDFGLNVDVIDETQELEKKYRVIVAPLMYMERGDIAEKLKKYVKDGGILFLTLWSGIADENDRCFTGGTPHDLMDLCGLRTTEIDGLYDCMEGEAFTTGGRYPELGRKYIFSKLFEYSKLDTAEAIMEFQATKDSTVPAVTENCYGKGKCFMILADFGQELFSDLIRAVLRDAGIKPIIGDGSRYNPESESGDVFRYSDSLPAAVSVTSRIRTAEALSSDDGTEEGKAVSADALARYIFIQNWNDFSVTVPVPEGFKLLTDDGCRKKSEKSLEIEALSTAVVEIVTRGA